MRTAKTLVHHIAITKARVNLGAVVKRAHLKGEYFILEKDGIPVAGLKCQPTNWRITLNCGTLASSNRSRKAVRMNPRGASETSAISSQG